MTHPYVCLDELAAIHTPPGTEKVAVIDQWVHALATQSQFYCDRTKSTPQALRSNVTQLLYENGQPTQPNDVYERYIAPHELRPPLNPNFTFIDLFAGVGGFRIALQQKGGACVFSSELDSHARAAYKRNYGETPSGETPSGDITEIDPRNIPQHDVLCAGFPCQPFSRAGKELGIADTRGTLFHNIAEIIRAKRPKMALLENVKGLISNDGGRTLRTILARMTECGYECNIPHSLITNGTTKELQTAAKAMLLDAADFGVPQTRKRLFMVFWRRHLIDHFPMPKPLNTPTRLGSVLEREPQPSFTISDKLWSWHQRRVEENRKKGRNFGYSLVTPDTPATETILARYHKDGAQALLEQAGMNPRKLTPREVARLQGFPDSFLIESSNTQAYTQFGNSVAIPVVAALAETIKTILTKEEL